MIADWLTAEWLERYFPIPAQLTGVSMQETDRNRFEVFLPRASRRQCVAMTSSESVIVNA